VTKIEWIQAFCLNKSRISGKLLISGITYLFSAGFTIWAFKPTITKEIIRSITKNS
jgi:hypothetical protein